MSEFIIENLTVAERKVLMDSDTDITWFPEDFFDDENTNIIVEGSEDDADTVLKLIGRKVA